MENSKLIKDQIREFDKVIIDIFMVDREKKYLKRYKPETLENYSLDCSIEDSRDDKQHLKKKKSVNMEDRIKKRIAASM